MDYITHFSQYRRSLKKDALEGCVDFSKTIPTNRPEAPTAYDYLKIALQHAEKYAASSDYYSYSKYLYQHRAAMVKLFERMVSLELCEVPPERITQDMYFSLINEKGWKWYKFCPTAMSISYKFTGLGDEMIDIVPRYYGDFCDFTGRPLFDADEMIFLDKHEADLGGYILLWKKERPGFKITGMRDIKESPSNRSIIYKPSTAVNKEEVIDWSLQLFF